MTKIDNRTYHQSLISEKALNNVKKALAEIRLDMLHGDEKLRKQIDSLVTGIDAVLEQHKAVIVAANKVKDGLPHKIISAAVRRKGTINDLLKLNARILSDKKKPLRHACAGSKRKAHSD